MVELRKESWNADVCGLLRIMESRSGDQQEVNEVDDVENVMNGVIENGMLERLAHCTFCSLDTCQ